MRTIKECRSCGGASLTEVLDLGDQYVSDFRIDNSKPNKYPLVALICDDCKLVQLRDTTPNNEMYHENYGFKSGTSNSIRRDLEGNVNNALAIKRNAQKWLDIASNDGTLLSFVPKDVYRVGVDPVTKLCKEAKQHADRIVNDFFRASDFCTYDEISSAVYEKFDIITSISCFYDMDDPNEFVSDVAKVLDANGVWVIQQNYLLPTLQINAVDNFCHEHIEYYTLLSLEPLLARHGLEVIDVTTSMMNGGSLRTVVAHKGSLPASGNVERQREIEKDYGLDTLVPYYRFARDVLVNLKKLKTLIDYLNDAGKTIYILAASTRGATIWQSANIDVKDIPFAVERNPEKVGRYFSALGIPIISEEEARNHKPDYMLVGPWFFIDEIKERESEYLKGGHFIVPLPNLEVI